MGLEWRRLLWESIKGFPIGMMFGIAFVFSFIVIFITAYGLGALLNPLDVQRGISESKDTVEALAILFDSVAGIAGGVLSAGVLGSMIMPIKYYMGQSLKGKVCFQLIGDDDNQEVEKFGLKQLKVFGNCYLLYLMGLIVGVVSLVLCYILVALMSGHSLSSIEASWLVPLIFDSSIKWVLRPGEIIMFLFLPMLGVVFLEQERPGLVIEKDNSLIPKPKNAM